MDLEYLLRACWRRKLRILAFMAIFAVVLGVGVAKLKPLSYAATAQVVVYPDGLNAAANSAYGADPDRYVANQVAVADSPHVIAAVADQLKLSPAVVGKMVSVKQVSKTDVIQVKASSASPSLSQKVSIAVAKYYVDYVTNLNNEAQQTAIASLQNQLNGVAQKLQTARAEAEAAPNNQQLGADVNSYLQTQTALTQSLQTLENASASIGTNLVSNTPSAATVVGTTRKKLVIYGLVLGMVLGIAQVAVTAGPGRSLENLGAVSEVDGVPVVGVMRSRRSRLGRLPHVESRFLSRLPGMQYLAAPPGRGTPNIIELRIAQEIAFTLRMKGQIAMIPIGSHKVERMAATALHGLLGKKRFERQVIAPGRPTIAEVTICPLITMVSDDTPESSLPSYLAVDVAKVKPKELTDVIATLRSTGAEILGIIGLQ